MITSNISLGINITVERASSLVEDYALKTKLISAVTAPRKLLFEKASAVLVWMWEQSGAEERHAEGS